MIRAVIFDYDGTIADTIPEIWKALNITMAKIGLPELTQEQVVQAINGGARNLIQNLLPPQMKENEDEVSRVFAIYRGDYGSTYLDTKKAYDGIPELVTELHQSGVFVAVLSNKDHTWVGDLVRQTLPKEAVSVAQGVIHGKPVKPDPYLPNRVCAMLGVSPDECVMVGDSDVDFYTAQTAGMKHIGVTWGYRSEELLREKGATVFAHTAEELGQILSSMRKGE